MEGDETLRLLPELARAGLWRAGAPFRVWWRRHLGFGRPFQGPLPDHIVFHPWDAMPRRLEEADRLLRGRFRFHGTQRDIAEGASVFDLPAPTPAWQMALHSFAWLPALSTAGADNALILATSLTDQWLRRYRSYSEPIWLPHILARRLAAIFSHGQAMILNADRTWRSRLFVSLRAQIRVLERTVPEAPDGLPRFEAAAVLALSGICFTDSPKRRNLGLMRLQRETERQILPDGGHVSRSPQALLGAYRHLVMVLEALRAVDQEPPQTLQNAHDRIAPMLRFFRHGDGGLALFNGGGQGDPRVIAELLARDSVRGQPFEHARYSGYQRLTAGRTLVLLDCGKTPHGEFARGAHAGAGAFEFSCGPDRIVVNCGTAGLSHQAWSTALRATAAHSTLTLCDTSCAHILPAGAARDLLGPRLLGGPVAPTSRRMQTAQGWAVEVTHDAYVRSFGVRHERQISLSPQGLVVTGSDRLVPADVPARPSRQRRFALRFHIHPDVRVSRLEGGAVLLKLPAGRGWRFRSGAGALEVEESVYCAGPGVRRAEQLVVRGLLEDLPTEIAWVFEQIVA